VEEKKQKGGKVIGERKAREIETQRYYRSRHLIFLLPSHQLTANMTLANPKFSESQFSHWS
jgi:hypothetical protein